MVRYIQRYVITEYVITGLYCIPIPTPPQEAKMSTQTHVAAYNIDTNHEGKYLNRNKMITLRMQFKVD